MNGQQAAESSMRSRWPGRLRWWVGNAIAGLAMILAVGIGGVALFLFGGNAGVRCFAGERELRAGVSGSAVWFDSLDNLLSDGRLTNAAPHGWAWLPAESYWYLPGAPSFNATQHNFGEFGVSYREPLFVDSPPSTARHDYYMSGLAIQARNEQHYGLVGSATTRAAELEQRLASANIHRVRLPLWFVFLLMITYPIVRFIHLLRQSHRKSAGLCQSCGYDLRATPDRCPECGAVVAGTPATIP